VLDLQARRDYAQGEGLFIHMQVTVAGAIGAGTPMVHFCPIAADDAALSVNATVLGITGGPAAFAVVGPPGFAPGLQAATLPINRSLVMPLPRSSPLLFGADTFSGAESGLRDIPTTLTAPSYMQRFLGLIALQPNWSTNYFSAATIRGRLVIGAASLPRSTAFAGTPGAQ
jgi:hypothetical protein